MPSSQPAVPTLSFLRCTRYEFSRGQSGKSEQNNKNVNSHWSTASLSSSTHFFAFVCRHVIDLLLPSWLRNCKTVADFIHAADATSRDSTVSSRRRRRCDAIPDNWQLILLDTLAALKGRIAKYYVQCSSTINKKMRKKLQNLAPSGGPHLPTQTPGYVLCRRRCRQHVLRLPVRTVSD